MKKIKIILVVLFINLIIVNNISFASSISNEKIQASIYTIFENSIQIESKSDSGNSSYSADAYKIIDIDDSKIEVSCDELEDTLIINYEVEEEIYKFNTIYEYNLEEDSDMDQAMKMVVIAFWQNDLMIRSYLAVADTMGVDLSLAYTYFWQKEDGSGNISNDIFKYTINTDENISEFNLEMDTNQISKLDSTKLDSSSFATVTIGDYKTEETEEEKVNNTENADTKQEENADNTTSTTILPKTGIDGLKIVLIVGILILLILYFINKKYKDIK